MLFRVVFALLFCAGVVLSHVPEASADLGRTFYVDAMVGSDRNSGRTPGAAVKTLQGVPQLDLHAGDRVLLRAGQVHRGPLVVAANGAAEQRIILGRFGTGGDPVVQGGGCVQIRGSYWEVRSVVARSCDGAGFEVAGDHVVLHDVVATDNLAGVRILPGADRAVVRHSRLYDNDRMAADTPGPDDDYGANGIVVSGDGAQIVQNMIVGHVAPSSDYGYDGSAIEIWGAIGTRVSRNVARENLDFTELGGSRTRNTAYDYNLITSTVPKAHFLLTRGPSTFGPVYGTVARHNSVRLTGANAMGISCHPGCGRELLTLSSNVISAPVVGYAEALDGLLASVSAGHNVYDELVEDGYFGLRLAASDVRAPARFADTRTLTLRRDAAAVDVGGAAWPTDIAGIRTPQDGNRDGRALADAGARERPRR